MACTRLTNFSVTDYTFSDPAMIVPFVERWHKDASSFHMLSEGDCSDSRWCVMFVASPYCGVFKEREESTHIQRDDVV
jgi:hypothetical protein